MGLLDWIIGWFSFSQTQIYTLKFSKWVVCIVYDVVDTWIHNTNTQYTMLTHNTQHTIHNIVDMFEIAQVACACMLAIASSAELHAHTMLCTLFDSKGLDFQHWNHGIMYATHEKTNKCMLWSSLYAITRNCSIGLYIPENSKKWI